MSPIAVSVGTFDGVHRGHRRLLATAADRAAAAGLELVVLTLDRHPLSLLRPERAPRLLTGLDHKLELLAGLGGVSRVEVLAFDRQRADQSPASFVLDTLVGELGARLLVVGGNFRFGRGGAGDVTLVAELGAPVGLEVVGLPLLEGAPGAVISSSEIRRLVAVGHLARAASLLGRLHEVRGELAPAVPAGAGGSTRLGLLVDPVLLLPPPGAHRAVVAPLGAAREPAVPAFAEVGADLRAPAAAAQGGLPPAVGLALTGHPVPPWWRPGVAVRVGFEATTSTGEPSRPAEQTPGALVPPVGRGEGAPGTRGAAADGGAGSR